jgi:carboxymethylenebutenolidase
MGETVRLKANDGHELGAYRARPKGKPRGGLVVIQEIFGVNDHIRRVADGYAEAGYSVIAPALFDRVGHDIQLGYEDGDIQRGRALKEKCGIDEALADIAAARATVADAGKVAVVGYCWGGFLAWLAATRLDRVAASISYYGGGVHTVAAEKPRCPVLMHFGEHDHAIPPESVDAVRSQNHPGVEIYLYPAGHGFNCDERGSYDAESARVALERSLAFLATHIG